MSTRTRVITPGTCRPVLLGLALGTASALAFALPAADTDQAPPGHHLPANHAQASGHAASSAGDHNPERQRPTGSNEGSGTGHGVSGTTSSGGSGASRAINPGRISPSAPGAAIGGGQGAGGSGNSGAVGNAGASTGGGTSAPGGSAASGSSSSGAATSSNEAASTSSTTGIKRRQP